MATQIRRAKETDLKHICETLDEAFAPSTLESALVKSLWQNEKISAHFVAEDAQHIVGYVALSLALTEEGLPVGFHLAPIGVAPAFQRRGIGTQLVRHAIEDLGGALPIFVLGDPKYYGRFGFTVNRAVRSRFDESGEHFQTLGELRETSGLIDYENEFAEAFGG